MKVRKVLTEEAVPLARTSVRTMGRTKAESFDDTRERVEESQRQPTTNRLTYLSLTGKTSANLMCGGMWVHQLYEIQCLLPQTSRQYSRLSRALDASLSSYDAINARNR